MKDGFIKIELSTPNIKLGNLKYNIDLILDSIKKSKESNIIVFPRMITTGLTIGDLCVDGLITDKINEYIFDLASSTKGINKVVVLGSLINIKGNLYDCGVVIYDGHIIGIAPNYNNNSTFLSHNYIDAEFISINNEMIKLSNNGYFSINNTNLSFLLDFDIKSSISKINNYNVNIVINLTNNNYIAGRYEFVKNLTESLSTEYNTTFVTIDPAISESTTDYVYSGMGIVAIDGKSVITKAPFDDNNKIGLIDYKMKHKLSDSFNNNSVVFDIDMTDVKLEFEDLNLLYSKMPYNKVLSNSSVSYYEEILNIQVQALVNRMKAINTQKLVVGISGGLDSTLALLVSVFAVDKLGLDRENVIAVTMPCFGTTDATYNNACKLIKLTQATFKEINIKDSVTKHFEDINHKTDLVNVTYENAQARMRTMILMDIANDNNGIVVGTGDLSELALGWATYNGDHMSMYSVNGGIPKTLMKSVVGFVANNLGGDILDVLTSIVDTPISPELLPLENGKSNQKTEEKVGPYILHDFYLYCMLVCRFSPSKINRISQVLFKEDFGSKEIKKWLEIFYKRFFSSQYKRSCLPDGPMVIDESISPRCALHMPSDMNGEFWINNI